MELHHLRVGCQCCNVPRSIAVCATYRLDACCCFAQLSKSCEFSSRSVRILIHLYDRVSLSLSEPQYDFIVCMNVAGVR